VRTTWTACTSITTTAGSSSPSTYWRAADARHLLLGRQLGGQGGSRRRRRARPQRGRHPLCPALLTEYADRAMDSWPRRGHGGSRTTGAGNQDCFKVKAQENGTGSAGSAALSDIQRQRNHARKIIGKPRAGRPHARSEKRTGKRTCTGTAPLTANAG
jgi:hypothetical protein